MGYFDGNTVTALWNYAQHFAISDSFFASNFGESTRGALNLTVGDTYGVVCGPSANVYGDVPECGGPVDSTSVAAPGNGNVATLNVDADPYWDVCSNGETVAFTGRNVGDLLNAAGSHLGLVPGRLHRRRERPVREQPPARGVRPCDRRRPGDRSAALRGLRAAPQPVPVLRLDREPAAPAADVGRHGRAHRPGEPLVRPVVVLGRGGSGQPADRVVPEGARLPERTPRQLDSRSTSRSSSPRR